MSKFSTTSADDVLVQHSNFLHSTFNEIDVLHELKHYLPAQAPLKDFIHHNTLHAFQSLKFNEAMKKAAAIFGYRVSLSLHEYRDLYVSKKIGEDVLVKIIEQKKGKDKIDFWKSRMIEGHYEVAHQPRIGQLRSFWKRKYKIDLDALVHPTLFRVVCSYLDQGISIWRFPNTNLSFLASIRQLEKSSFSSFFRTKRARQLLYDTSISIKDLLKIIIGDEALFEHYLFDQQFAHQGWSGLVSAAEDNPAGLLDSRSISLKDFVHFELLLEIDALQAQFGDSWSSINQRLKQIPTALFAPIETTELEEVVELWQDALEWSFYDQVLKSISDNVKRLPKQKSKTSFQALFCIDDRECSLRRYVEEIDPSATTYGTPGFFGVEFYFQPESSKFFTKQCPAPVSPKYLIKEFGSNQAKTSKDFHFGKYAHSLIPGMLITHTIGLWSAFKLAINLFKPSIGPASAHSFDHMDRISNLTIECEDKANHELGLQIGFTVDEMTMRVNNVLTSIGMIKDFADIIYVVGHGASSINNPHYAAYDCGACSGRPGSVNARVFSFMANHPKVRAQLKIKGIDIPPTTQFVGALHDTTKDDIEFYDEDLLHVESKIKHHKYKETFKAALDKNALERSRRFELVDKSKPISEVHKQIRGRSVSLFEPRPELNHATNAITIIGRRAISSGVFLDRRSFLNSYDYSIDPKGSALLNILKAAAPVCGGINLEYYFSRVDNQKLGAGTKLPHNVMGLFGVANGIDGDLRPGLPMQMVEIHDPIRMLFIVEHKPDVVLDVIKQSPETYEWFINNWVHLVVLDPFTSNYFKFDNGQFVPYQYSIIKTNNTQAINQPIYLSTDNLPIFLQSNQ